MRRVVRVVMVLLWTYVGTHGQAVNPDGKVLKLDATGTQRWEWLGVKDSVTNNAWALVGNSGTNPTTHFVGTTDNADLVFRTQNIERMRIDVNGRVGIGTPTPTAVLHIAEGGSDLLRVVNETTPSLEGIPIRYAARLYPQGLNGTAESAGLYGRIDPTGSNNNLVGIYGEITSAQDDGEGAFLKVVHFGKGDAIYIPLFSTGGAAYEAASFANGTTGFRATLQNPAIPKPYTVHFNALWGETTIPAYGIFYADQSPGNAFTIRKLSTALDNQTQIRLVEDNLVRERFSVFNDGSVRLSSLEADAANTVRNSPPLILRGAYWTGAASADYDWTIHNVMAGASPLASRLIIQDGGGNDRVTITNDGLVGVNTPPSFYTVDILTQTPWSGLRVRGTSHAQIAVEAPAGNAAQFTLIENGTTRYSLYLRSSTQLGIGLFDAAGNYVADALIINAPGSTGPGYSIHREGGNTRGLYAIDLQGERSDLAQVASGNYSVIAGGASNTASGYAATVAGGASNTASDTAATVGGGADNTASGDYATVGGGGGNTASGYGATVGGGERDTASGNHATVGGGYNNTASGNYSVVGGGYSNTASSESTTVSGGGSNTASGNFATVGGGGSNTASAYGATVGGGVFNTASGYVATVGGGYNNTASDTAATVGGGAGNTASGYAATVAGGASNTASGNYSVVVGGSGNTANGQYNLVFGQNVVPNPTADYHVYLFGPGGAAPMGFLAMNRLAPVSAGNVIQVGTGNNNGNGASLTTGGIWTNASSRAFKDRFRPLAAQEVLMKIRSLPVEGWYYKGTEEYHIGPYAEDFYAAFGTGVREIIEMDSTGQLVRRPNPEVNKYLAASDVAGVALLGVKGVAEQVESVARQWGERLQAVEQDNQRLRQEVERLGQENEQLRARLQRLEELVEQLRQQCCVGGGQKGRAVEIHDAWLGQNIPNPFEGTTTIPYYIPSGVSRAELVVRDLGGRELRRVELPERGAHGQITLEMRLLGSGTYEYALVLDGRTVATRQMQLIK